MKRNEKGQFIKGQRKDYTGMRYGKLVFVEYSHTKENKHGKRHYWKLKCDCGNDTVKCARDVVTRTRSCGCLHKINTSKAKKTHGDSDSRLYYIWENMKKRCYKPNSDRYKNYGARGIRICDEWLDYQNFFDWANSNGYKETLTIERIDLNKNYEPSNCTWITMEEQAKNRTTNKWVYLDDKKYSPLELEEMYNIPVKTIYARIARGDTSEAVVRPLGQRQFYKR